MKTCGDCKHAQFSLTPTGRFKKAYPGRCSKDYELRDAVNHTAISPCLVRSHAFVVAVWPEYDATHCAAWKAR